MAAEGGTRTSRATPANVKVALIAVTVFGVKPAR
jgi:hypothetical protein